MWVLPSIFPGKATKLWSLMKLPILRCILLILIFCSTSSCNKEFIEATSTCTTTLPPTSNTHPKAGAYQQLLDTYTKRGLPGIFLLIRDQYGTWAGSAGKADIEKNIAMSPCHISKVASITKMFVATATMQLVEEGKLGLDEKINRWLPSSITGNIENASQATLRQLLNHRTGIYDIIDETVFI
jgi:D-alanyl-D-alanine carboxypeptidase